MAEYFLTYHKKLGTGLEIRYRASLGNLTEEEKDIVSKEFDSLKSDSTKPIITTLNFSINEYFFGIYVPILGTLEEQNKHLIAIENFELDRCKRAELWVIDMFEKCLKVAERVRKARPPAQAEPPASNTQVADTAPATKETASKGKPKDKPKSKSKERIFAFFIKYGFDGKFTAADVADYCQCSETVVVHNKYWKQYRKRIYRQIDTNK